MSLSTEEVCKQKQVTCIDDCQGKKSCQNRCLKNDSGDSTFEHCVQKINDRKNWNECYSRSICDNFGNVVGVAV